MSSPQSQNVRAPGVRPGWKKNVPYGRAVRLCGGEERLKRGLKSNVTGNWKKRGVPALHVLNIYEELVLEAGRQPPPPPPATPLAQVLDYAKKVYEAMKQSRYRERDWKMLELLAGAPLERKKP